MVQNGPRGFVLSRLLIGVGVVVGSDPAGRTMAVAAWVGLVRARPDGIQLCGVHAASSAVMRIRKSRRFICFSEKHIIGAFYNAV
jgi:hypothetical protein